MDFVRNSKVTAPHEALFEKKLIIIRANCSKSAEFEGDICFPNRCLKHDARDDQKELDRFMARKAVSLDQISDSLEQKQLNLVNLISGKRRGLEIGFNAGSSAMLMLLHNPDMVLTVVDLGSHAYTSPCFAHLEQTFGSERIALLRGDSVKLLPKLIEQSDEFDFIHIDGGHSLAVARQDLSNAHALLSPNGGTLLFDDTNSPNLKALVIGFAAEHGYTEISLVTKLPFEHSAFVRSLTPPSL
jgi:predicted O-methyltransferase YrrM